MERIILCLESTFRMNKKNSFAKNLLVQKNPKAKKVVCEELIYDTLSDFCKKNELKSSTVSQWLNGKVKMPSVWVNKGLKYYIEEGD